MLEANLHQDVVDEFYHARVVIGTTAAKVIAGNIPNAVKGVQLKAAITNAGIIYIGNSWVTAGGTAATDGTPLSASEGLFVPVKDVSKIHAVASTTNQNLYWFMV